MIGRLFQRRNKAKVDTVAALAEFLEQRAALISQKSVVGYCNVKTMLPLFELMKDKPFADAFEVSRWEAFGAALADLVVVADQYLRPASGTHAIGDALAALYSRVLSRHPVPAHRGDGWTAEINILRRRLADARLAAPQPVGEIAKVSAQRIFETMPIHERLREPDGPAIKANVQFLMVGMAHEFESRLDGPAIVADMRQSSAATAGT
jgi:hypothetical protein